MSGTGTKSAMLREMLGRGKGASLGEICAATGWQPHSARAVISGLRKKGGEICLDPPATAGAERRYRIVGGGAIVPTAEAGRNRVARRRKTSDNVVEPDEAPHTKRTRRAASSPANASGCSDTPASAPERADG